MGVWRREIVGEIGGVDLGTVCTFGIGSGEIVC